MTAEPIIGGIVRVGDESDDVLRMTERPFRKERGKAYRGPVVDCDVHHDWVTQSDFLPYLSEGWREYVTSPRRAQVPMSMGLPWPNLTGGNRTNTYPDEAGNPGSSYELMRDQLLDPFDVRRAVLTYGDVLFGLNRLRNPYFAMEVMRAANEWTHDQWLSRDNRLVGTILIANHIPELAAKEIRRASADRRFRAVLICGNAIGQPLGHPIYHPIYEAAAEAGLPLAIHGGGEGPTYPAAAGGFLNFYLEFHALRFQPVATDVVSLILNGVFDKYPALRILLMEAGVSWIPGVFWRLDEDYKGLRREIPWLKKLPSEYFSEHFRLTTQPLDVSPQREGLIDLLRSCGGDDLLVYSSDYPHWDADEVDYVATRLPKDWLPGVFWKNAADFFGWEESVFSDAVSDTASHLRAERE